MEIHSPRWLVGKLLSKIEQARQRKGISAYVEYKMICNIWQ